MESNLLIVTSFHGWRIGQWKLHRYSPCVHRCLHQVSPWSGMTIFMQILRIKLVLLNFRRYLGEIESGGGNNLVFLMCFVLCVCSAVSGSALPMFKSQLSNKSGGAKAFGNMSVFWLAPLALMIDVWSRVGVVSVAYVQKVKCMLRVLPGGLVSNGPFISGTHHGSQTIIKRNNSVSYGPCNRTATANRQIYACAFGLCRF